MSKAKVVRYPCAACGKASPASEMVFSRATKNRYCLDAVACDRRRKRKKGKP